MFYNLFNKSTRNLALKVEKMELATKGRLLKQESYDKEKHILPIRYSMAQSLGTRRANLFLFLKTIFLLNLNKQLSFFVQSKVVISSITKKFDDRIDPT